MRTKFQGKWKKCQIFRNVFDIKIYGGICHKLTDFLNEIAEDLFRDLATYLVEKVYCKSVTTVTVGCALVMHFAHCDWDLLVKYTPYSSLTEIVTRYRVPMQYFHCWHSWAQRTNNLASAYR